MRAAFTVLWLVSRELLQGSTGHRAGTAPIWGFCPRHVRAENEWAAGPRSHGESRVFIQNLVLRHRAKNRGHGAQRYFASGAPGSLGLPK